MASGLGRVSQGLDIFFLGCLSGTSMSARLSVRTSHHSLRSLERYPVLLGLPLEMYPFESGERWGPSLPGLRWLEVTEDKVRDDFR